MRVLVIEDSAPTRDLLVRSLSDAGMTVVTAARLSTGLRSVMSGEFDVLVLDLMLPDGDGLDLCREVRAAGVSTPILCLTARADVADRVKGLDAGADDYLRKPFALAELHARIRALARRGGLVPPKVLTAGSVTIDFAARRLSRRGEEIGLTAREWKLLEFVWEGASIGASASLDVILGRLRRKLGDVAEGCRIRTLRGEGFVFETRT